MKSRLVTLAVLLLGACLTSVEGASLQPPPASLPAVQAGCADVGQPAPMIVFISDLHLGLGRTGDHWNPWEDFRWPKALRGFLGTISEEGHEHVALVIVGDLFEMWQHPNPCVGLDPDHGCKFDEASNTLETILAAHRAELDVIADFANRGSNSVVIIPGNHDSALLIPEIYEKVKGAIPVHEEPRNSSPRLSFTPCGAWQSSDGKIVAEHGHQIDDDLNKYKGWPNVSSKPPYIDRPWGELVVQSLFNEAETNFPIVDNVLPLKAGLEDYLDARGPLGGTEAIARLIYFNAVEISVQQMADLGGTSGPGAQRAQISPDGIRRRLGYKLVAYALPSEDRVRKELLDQTQTNPEWLRLRDATQALVSDKHGFSDDEVLALCDVLQARAAKAASHQETSPTCSESLGGEPQTLGKAAFSRLTQREDAAVANHIRTHWKSGGNLKLYVYAHTHEARIVDSLAHVAVYNTGAFQRLITYQALHAQAPANGDTAQLLSQSPEALAACYSAVVVKYSEGDPQPELRTWYMRENDLSGKFVARCSPQCASMAPECQGSR